ncbi:MAG: helix-turn-helix-type transcriptional regulator [Treponematales bacterium]
MKKRIKTLRERLGLSHEDFGSKLSTSKGHVYAWENGNAPLPDAKILLICALWRVSENWLRTGEGEMFTAQQPPSALPTDEQELLNIFRQLLPEIKQLALRRLAELLQDTQRLEGKWIDLDP